ncbi:MAG: hypothetical protein MK316_07285 [Pseudomonadales bacterium]|nr:hypothetical protein [Pseudomonadales bacterium]
MGRIVKSIFLRRFVGVAVVLSFAWFSGAKTPSTAPLSQDSTEATASAIRSFAEHTDAELTQIAGQIKTLNAAQRRGLITEMRRRMTETGLKPKVEANFGRIIQSASASMTRLETIRIIRKGEYGRGGRGVDSAVSDSETKKAPKTVLIEGQTH